MMTINPLSYQKLNGLMGRVRIGRNPHRDCSCNGPIGVRSEISADEVCQAAFWITA